jgi:alkylation response protein AidB-like acyl-CoA dehydrogenase
MAVESAADSTGFFPAFSTRQRTFLLDVRNFLENEIDPDDLSSPEAHANEHSAPIYADLARRGWLGMNLPVKYGGMGGGAVDLAIFRDWTSYYRVPLGGFTSASRIGHAIHLLGTDEQRQFFLRGLTAGELIFCIGYTEPGAGSDLAGLRTRATRHGDTFVVNGQKIFTTAAHLADYVFLACRTDPDAPRHRGISVLLVDLHSPGIRIDPIWTLGGWRLNTVFYDDVEVPAENLIGELNGGWRVIRAALDVERTGMQPIGLARRVVDDLWRTIDLENAAPVVDRAHARRRLGELDADIAAARLISYKLAWNQDRGKLSSSESAISKLLGSEVYQRSARACAELLGGDVFIESDESIPLSQFEREYRYAPQSAIAMGTQDIMRNVIARERLGLPV